MPETFVPLEKSENIVKALLKKKGGMAAMAVSSVPEILADWKAKGISGLMVDIPKLQEALK